MLSSNLVAPKRTTTDNSAGAVTSPASSSSVASSARKAGWRKRAIEVREGDTVATVRDRLVEEHPQLRPAVPSLLYALNEEYAREWDPVPAGATLAFIPPVSGGCSC
jgi:molybdopterin converting factor small subunit